MFATTSSSVPGLQDQDRTNVKGGPGVPIDARAGNDLFSGYIYSTSTAVSGGSLATSTTASVMSPGAGNTGSVINAVVRVAPREYLTLYFQVTNTASSSISRSGGSQYGMTESATSTNRGFTKIEWRVRTFATTTSEL